MNTLDHSLAWANIPVPEALLELTEEQQHAVASYARALVEVKTEGFEELYQAISMIVKYIPSFIVIPLMVEHIRPQIAAGVCRKMGVEQATHYANDLPLEYFSEVSLHIDDQMMAQILEKMKRHQAEKVIEHELRLNLTHILDIAVHLEGRMFDFIARSLTLPEQEEALIKHPDKGFVEKIRSKQR
jgi:hypothetical protein